MRFSSILLLLLTASAASPADPGIWKVAPAPPASWQRDRLADLSARRKAVMDRIGPHGMLILYAAEPRNYANDVDWPFRQENDFFYLTGLTQPGATLVLAPGAATQREIVFIPTPVPSQETWTGHMMTAAEATSTSGIRNVFDAGQFARMMSTIVPRAAAILNAPGGNATGGGRAARGGRGATASEQSGAPSWESDFAGPIHDASRQELQVYMILPARPGAVEYRREQEFAGKLASVGAGVTLKDATAIFGELRRVKSQREIDILQHAVDITGEAFQRVFAVAVPETPEYEIQAQFEFTFLRRNGHWGYPCIVGSGVNATTLHYESNRDTMKAGDLLLLDDAAEFDQYSADVTRTIPVSGKFSHEQAEIYRLVYDAQQAGIGKTRQGHSPLTGADSIQGAANQVFKAGLYKLGLITDPTSDAQMKVWTIHGISHGIGLNVHDPDGRELQPGMVVTVEPGLYFRPDALDNLPHSPEMEEFAKAVRPAFEKYKGIGIRIEDDVLVTTGEPKVLSAAIPSKLEDVEAAIARLRAAMKTTPMP